MRKDAGFELTDRIYIDFAGTSENMLKLIEANQDKIMAETLAKGFVKIDKPEIDRAFELSLGTVQVKMTR